MIPRGPTWSTKTHAVFTFLFLMRMIIMLEHFKNVGLAVAIGVGMAWLLVAWWSS